MHILTGKLDSLLHLMFSDHEHSVTILDFKATGHQMTQTINKLAFALKCYTLCD